MLAGLRLAQQNGDAERSAEAERRAGREGDGETDMPLTPVLSAHWDEADSYTIDGYRRHGGYGALALALRPGSPTTSSSS